MTREGIGKTYLAAFDSKKYEKVLFVAHREEILLQAMESFKNIRPNSSSGFFYSDFKETDKDIVFATIQTLGKKEYLNDKYFKKDYFDYIIIDEFHHAVAGNYKNILDYFNPKFMLGLTATPERLDNKDVFSLCDYNLVYEVRLGKAINKDWLVPFRYYGIFDNFVDYTKIEIDKGKYNEKQLESALMINKRGELILNHYRKYNSKRALGFCSSRKHAEYMAKFFNDNGIKASVVVSNSKSEFVTERKKAIKDLIEGNISIIFSVDMFNEGVDIPSLDMVMFLRPTESPTVFLQQLGRGLRKYKDKKYVNVLDFIGNFKKANMIPFLLAGKSNDGKGNGVKNIKEEDYPEDCIVDFDFRLVDLFEKIERESKKIKEIIIEEYYRIKEELEHTPTRLDIFTYMDNDIYNNMRKSTKLNILNDYISFLHCENEIETEKVNSIAHDFIKMLENTRMSQLYKMPLLLAFYNNGNIKLKISEDDIYESFENFYSMSSNSVDLARNKSTENYRNFKKKDYLKLAENPRQAFIKTHKEFFYEENNFYCLNNELSKYIEDDFFKKHFKDTIEYRTKRFYKERLE